ncbi:type V toxin-antitoxin system endoribonuclease antitoxin GhoS [Erwinia aphidicola]|jgi:hypothetical protein|uniref:Type V toxin-antitoxin system endoribonuclease antitoxin GhoS n=1 Tax=Erwinia aphidicola TaxID=68334 RepID=A0ABU8DHS6_ERWAP|nr:type V toxin-antitoxin system endoribonuclease antitoxin GhoS [Erwinia sp. V90_4]KMV70397.1 hypothetical protein AI28_22905 [bacteria symbiont BFo1 of Frankliniella occidentalis]MBN1086091.1 type V toxin-antitoxin system endoribonuclease antitoxin GhoS [Erwinia aphidicola]PIJ57661.1 hypothetical protein BOM23_13430 [Erwinia sp. OLMDLW33]KYP84767.1 hypothetical protein WB66_11175 [bacteria symbiont BFo1 of Frankliniella occidentalis]KYP89923.1 hypothetical protein WB91_11060 [bacteria symbio
MNSQSVEQFVVTFRYQEKGLSDLLELNSALLSAGFSTTLNDSQGHPHELGTNSFGITSAMAPEEIAQQARSAGELVLGDTPEVDVQRWEEFQQQLKS